MSDAPEPAESGKEPEAKEPEGKEPEKKVGEEQTPPWGSDEEFDPQRAWKLIQGVRTDLDKVKGERDELKGKVTKHEDATKSEKEKLEERAGTAEKEGGEAKQEAARLKVALKKGLTETQAKRLVGEDEEALEKDADELLASFKDPDDDESEQDPPRRPKERLRPGAAPSAGADKSSPEELAKAVPRRF